jgi:hypothetical protein
MGLPSNVPRYDSVDLVDLDHLEYLIVHRPKTSPLRAWGKLQETERRWAMFDWATHVIREPNRCVMLINDFATAFLLSFEATLQVLKAEAKLPQPFEAWLRTLPDNDLVCRGLRTLRHLEAHVRTGTLAVSRVAIGSSRFASGGGPGSTIPWLFPEMTASDISVALQTPRITLAELPAWNTIATQTPAVQVMRQGLTSLTKIVVAADP